jgi:hypothetical protein
MNLAVIRRGPWRGAFALALAALSLLVLAPVCTAFEVAGTLAFDATAVQATGQGHEGPCCSSVDEAVSVAATKSAATGSGAMHVAPGARPAFQIGFASPAVGISLHAAPPRSLDYHVRSARILS